jgi:hypothetical protein
MYKILITICCFQLSVCGNAQKITTIPFEELYGGVILIKAKIGNYKDTLQFIFDTGSSHISLDSATAADMKISVTETENLVNGIGGIRKVSKTDPLSLKFPKLTLDSISFNVNNYQILTESYGTRIDGIIGFAFISKFIFNVNFDSLKINVYKRGVYKYPKRGYLWKFNLNFIPTTILAIKENKKMEIPLYIDCGAGLGLLITESFVKDSTLFNAKQKIISAQVEGVGGVSNTRITTIKELKLGPYKFRNIPTYLYDDKNALLNYPYTFGLIGNDILRRFNWVLNYAKKEIYLTPNNSFYDNFDYAYTGLSIYQIDGFVKVTDIIENSPGDKAGFEKGDHIFIIEDNLITNVKKAKDLLQNTRKILKIIILRDGKPLELKLKALSII